MPFNYLACSIKGTAFSEYSSLLLITREMNSLPGGVSLPNTNPLPKHTLHLGPPSNPQPGPRAQLSSAHCGCGRHVNRPSGAGDTSATAPAPALRSPPRGSAPWTRPATHPLACSDRSPTRRRPNFLLWPHFPRQSPGPKWRWRKA